VDLGPCNDVSPKLESFRQELQADFQNLVARDVNLCSTKHRISGDHKSIHLSLVFSLDVWETAIPAKLLQFSQRHQISYWSINHSAIEEVFLAAMEGSK
jgi:hypothetical protein